MKRPGISDPELRKRTFSIAGSIMRLHHPDLSDEEFEKLKPELEELVEFIYEKFSECHRESVNGVLEIMDQMGNFPALRAKLLEFRDEV